MASSLSTALLHPHNPRSCLKFAKKEKRKKKPLAPSLLAEASYRPSGLSWEGFIGEFQSWGLGSNLLLPSKKSAQKFDYMWGWGTRGQSDDLAIQNSTWASRRVAAPRGREQDTGQPPRCRSWHDVEVLGLGDLKELLRT